MQLIPSGIDNALARSKHLVNTLKAIAHNSHGKARAFKTKKPRRENVQTFEGLELIEYLLNQGNPKEAQKVFNKLKREIDAMNKG